MPLLGLLGVFIVVLVVYWAIEKLSVAFELSPQIKTVVQVLLVVIAVLYLANVLLGGGFSLRIR